MGHARRQVLVDPSTGCHTSHRGYDVVTLETSGALALSVRAPIPQIVLSTATTSCLTDEQLSVVIGHEAAHLDHHHQAYLSVAGVVDACLGLIPFTGHSTAELRLALERWADEAAAEAIPCRRALRDALRSVAATMLDPAIAGLSSMDNLAERMLALGRPPVVPTRKERWVAYLPAAIAVIGLAAIIGLWHQQLLMVLALVGHCPN
jgi:beta-lactamase regulating signal transducer with metallopeptidase domain